jgi:quinate/shikimate dehydrogenase (NAD+)
MGSDASLGFPVLSHVNASPDVQQESILTGLIGRDIAASRSPWMHEQEARAQGLALTYTLFDFAAMGRDESYLCAQLMAAAARGFTGVNVTYPYKQAVIECLDELSPGAARVGAVNTIKFTNGKLIGHNTDVIGFAESIRNGLPGAPLGRVLQVGAGGGGAATAQALLELGTGTLIVCDKDRQRATALVAKLQENFGPKRAETTVDPAAVIRTVDGLVNATPLGMAASPQAPIDTSMLTRQQWVADIVYFPLETELLRGASGRGCPTLDGSRMAVYQAAAAFEIFTGRRADRARMLRSFVDYSAEASGSPD